MIKPDARTAESILASCIEEEDHIAWACLMYGSGEPVAESARAAEAAFKDLRESMGKLAGDYPRRGLARAFIEDGGGTMAILSVSQDLYLAAAAEPGSPLGAVSMTAGRMAEKLKQEI